MTVNEMGTSGIELQEGQLGFVVIGRNEGQRLVKCFEAFSGASNIVYVDSGSTDGSVQKARLRNIEVVELDMATPFTAARARNAGLTRLRSIFPDLRYVQFVDGDCELASGWTQKAISFLMQRTDVAAVCGRLRERHPDRSVYNWLCDKEWEQPSGEVLSCAGNVMMRSDALLAVNGYREDVIAGEESEVCIRLRQANWRIWRLEDEMAFHDAAMTHFWQWWRRSTRAGYAFANGSYLHGAIPERHFVEESRRIVIWGMLLPPFCVVLTVAFAPIGWLAWLVYPLQLLRLTLKSQGSFADRTRLAWFQLLSRVPEAVGFARFWWNLFSKRQPQIIEHK